MNQKKSSGGTTGRYVLRHILRSPGKSLLCLLLAAIFMLGLMLIRVSAIRSENELEHLYTTITVDVEITRARLLVSGDDGYIYDRTVENLINTGFITESYLEGKKAAVAIFPVNDLGEAIDPERFLLLDGVLYGTEYPTEFLDQWDIPGEITYFDGWDASVFLHTWEAADFDKPFPVVISQALYDAFELQPESLMIVGIRAKDSTIHRSTLTVIGTYPGDSSPLILSLEYLKHMPGVDLNYSRVILTIDPTMNRQLEEFRNRVSSIIAGGGNVDLTALYWDHELRQAIAPMEQVISFMKALYPVTLGLSFIVAAGIAVLLSLLSAKEAAILRVLGNSKTQCRVILCLQTVLVCGVGLILGHLGATAMAYIMLPAEDAIGLMIPALGRVGLYLLYTVLGAVGASAVMTGKNPLELLQVKE